MGCIEIQVRSNLDRGQILALYLVRRTNFQVSCVLEILFAYTKDTSWGSLDTEPVSWFWFPDPEFVVRSRPWPVETQPQTLPMEVPTPAWPSWNERSMHSSQTSMYTGWRNQSQLTDFALSSIWEVHSLCSPLLSPHITGGFVVPGLATVKVSVRHWDLGGGGGGGGDVTGL